MKIESLTELSKLLDLLNKKGVTQCSVDNLQLTLSGNPQPSNYKRKQEQTDDISSDTVEWSELSPEEQLFYSTGALPIEAK